MPGHVVAKAEPWHTWVKRGTMQEGVRGGTGYNASWGCQMSVAISSPVADYRRRALVRGIAIARVQDVSSLADWAGRDAVRAVFVDPDDVLVALHEHWVGLLSRRIYGDPQYPLGAERSRELYAGLVADHPGLRELLDKHSDNPAIAHLVNDERILLARAAGFLEHSSPATLAWRGRDLLETIPAQRAG